MLGFIVSGRRGRARTEPGGPDAVWWKSHELQRACAYALARIATSDSRVALEQKAKSSDSHPRDYGAEGLELWPLPLQRR